MRVVVSFVVISALFCSCYAIMESKRCDIAEFPFVVRIYTDKIFSGGFIIGASYVACTASHIEHVPENCIKVKGGNSNCTTCDDQDKSDEMSIDCKIFHPLYKRDCPTHNIAILHLTKCIKPNSGMGPVALMPANAKRVKENVAIRIAGFGATKIRPTVDFDDHLRCGDLYTISKKECELLLPGEANFDVDFCAGTGVENPLTKNILGQCNKEQVIPCRGDEGSVVGQIVCEKFLACGMLRQMQDCKNQSVFLDLFVVRDFIEKYMLPCET